MHPMIFHGTMLLLATITDVAYCDLMPRPQNKWAKLGDKKRVVLDCNSTFGYPLTWLIEEPGSSSQSEIYSDNQLIKHVDNVSSYCEVDNKVPGRVDLILNATNDAAQRYICLEPGSLKTASADLIIIESDPKCHGSSDNGTAAFVCSVQYRGNWAPVMEWKDGISGEVMNDSVATELVPNRNLTSRIAVPAKQSQNHGMYYTCTTRFRIEEKPSKTTADNVPSYTDVQTCRPNNTEVREADDNTVKIGVGVGIACFGILVFGGGLVYGWSKHSKKQSKSPTGRQNSEESKNLQISA